MPVHKSATNWEEYNAERVGFASYKDVYNMISDFSKSDEFYEIESAVVLQSYLDPKELPKKTNANGDKVPDFSFYGTIKARFLESQSEGDEIKGFIQPLSTHIITYPLKGEVVNVTVHMLHAERA